MLDLSNLDSKAVFCLGTTFGIGIGLCITYLTGSRKKSEVSSYKNKKLFYVTVLFIL